MPFGFYWDPTYILMIPCLILALWAQSRVQSTYRRYSAVPASRGWTAAMAARRILDENGLSDVQIRQVAGTLTDHYDPRSRTLSLSEGVFGSVSVAALGIAAHEVGHAIQHAHGYAPIRFRSALVPVANIGSRLSVPLIILGLVLSVADLAMAGVLLFAFATLFHLVTLPVEFNASSRALALLEDGGYMAREEVPLARKVLGAAALTYVAALLTSLMQLLRLYILAGGRRRRD